MVESIRFATFRRVDPGPTVERMGRGAPALPHGRSRRMRRSRMVALTGAVALATTALGATTATAALQATTTAAASTASSTPGRGRTSSSPTAGADARAVAAALRSERRDGHLGQHRHRARLGTLDVDRLPAARRGASTGVKAAADDGVVGQAPDAAPGTGPRAQGAPGLPEPVVRAREDRQEAAPKADPLDCLLWGMDMINAPRPTPSSSATRRSRSASWTPASTAATPTSRRTSTAGSRATSSPTCPTSTGRASTPAASTRSTWTTTATAPTSPAPSAAALNGIGVSGVAPGRRARQHARRPGQRLLLPQRRPPTR